MLDIFKFKNYPVRFVFLDGEIWFVAMDIAAILEYVDPSKMLNLVDDEDKRVENPHKLENSILAETFDSNTFRVSLVNESGLYACIFGSTKPEAKVFKKWVTSELLPTLRKTGKFEIVENDTLDSQKVLLNAMDLMTQMSITLENREKLLQQTIRSLSILEEERLEREYYLGQINEITKEHPLFSSLLQFAMMLKNEQYTFPSIGYTVRQILQMFPIRHCSEKRFANLCSDLYWLNKNKKPNEVGVYKYVGDELIYPTVILFKQENYSWDEIKERIEIDYKFRLPASNRRAFKEIMAKKERKLT